ncbi:MAG TPA: DUF2752 domain-containing protein [Verrucomicrobiae bacterium]|nr:DUF2752 domain-containing protein [Verrucomicrobiae bacterium]
MGTTSALNRWILGLSLAAIVITGTVLYCFDPAQCPFYPACLFHQATGLLCPGCGSLRALHQLLHGHFLAGFKFNPLLVLSFPLLGCFAAAAFMRDVQGRPLQIVRSTKWLWIGVALVFAFGVWRNIPGTLFATLPQ